MGIETKIGLIVGIIGLVVFAVLFCQAEDTIAPMPPEPMVPWNAPPSAAILPRPSTELPLDGVTP